MPGPVVIGDVYIDYHLDHRLVRLGGSFHACRLFGALGLPYFSAHTLPPYVEEEAEKQLQKLHPQGSTCFGHIENWPGIILIGDSTEASHQGYDEILRGLKVPRVDVGSLLKLVERNGLQDALMFPGSWTSPDLLNELRKRGVALHVDAQYLDDPIGLLDRLGPGAIETLFVSTSKSPLWKARQPAHDDLTHLRKSYAMSAVILKENRGGSQAFTEEGRFEAPAFPCDTLHSVGVGDVFDGAYLACRDHPVERRLRLASWVASQYAETLDYDVFAEQAAWSYGNASSVASYKGRRLSWEERQRLSVYIAGPDFPTVNTLAIDNIEAALKYHNFGRVRPIKDHGLDSPQLPDRDRENLFQKDVEAIQKANALIAVLPEHDPGTFAELGLAKGLGIPTIMFDPYGIVNNLFATKLPNAYCRNLPDVIDALFRLVGRQI